MLKIENRPKRGRPSKKNKRDVVLRVRLTAEEDQMLTEISKQMGLTKSAVIRNKIFTCYEKKAELLLPLTEYLLNFRKDLIFDE